MSSLAATFRLKYYGLRYHGVRQLPLPFPGDKIRTTNILIPLTLQICMLV